MCCWSSSAQRSTMWCRRRSSSSRCGGAAGDQMGAVADQVWAGGRRRRLRYLCRQGPFGLAAGNALPGTAGVELASRSRPTLPHPHPPQDIFRRYPNRYESIIATLCDNLESLDEPEAKASMIWIIGGGRGGQGGWGGLLRGTGTRGQCKRRPSARGSRWRRLACLPTAAVPGAVAPHACLTLCWRAGFWHGLQAALTVLSATPPVAALYRQASTRSASTTPTSCWSHSWRPSPRRPRRSSCSC
jgi:hypothetical protein